MTETMKRIFRKTVIASLSAAVALSVASCGKSDDAKEVPSTKHERNFIKEGNELYDKQRYAEAEVAYKKALEENPDNATAQFNLASSYLKQRGEDLANKGDSLVRTADAMLAKVAGAPDAALQESAFYDRGNVAYKAEDYAAAIEQYKNALRRNPDNDQARENLRLAQLKKQEQDKQNQDQQNQDQNQQNQDQDKQDKQQNQDQKDQQNQNKDKQDQQNQQDKQQQDQQKNQEQKQQQGGLSDASAAQILKAMEDKENGTRQKVELMKQGEEKRANRRTTAKPW